jgi:VWFA-related protein
MTPWVARACALGVALGGFPDAVAAVPPATSPPSEELPAATFGETVDVPLHTLVLRVVDTGGNPIPDLTAADLRVRVGGIEAPIVALDWVASAVETGTGGGAAASGVAAGGQDPVPASTHPALAEGRLLVVFVQADLHPSRIGGQMRLRPHTRELLATLQPGDRVAVASFDSHLKLRLDFSRDPTAIHAAIDRAMVYNPQGPVAPAAPFSMLPHFDAVTARAAASPERALELLARALEPLPGEKVLVYLGWGLGRYGATGVRMTPDFAPAVRALADARAAVFVLDVTSADEHSLAVGLETVAQATGGLYFSTFRLPAMATKILARAISGYYLLTLDGTSLRNREGPVRVDLRGRLGTVLLRRTSLD